MTPTAETRNSVAITRPTTTSGHARPVSATAPPAASTPTLPTTSFSEQVQADRMFTSSWRRGQSSARQATLAASATFLSIYSLTPGT